MSLELLVEKSLLAQVGGVELAIVCVVGEPELASNGEAVLAPLMPNTEAVDEPTAPRAMDMTSLERGLVAIKYHSSRFSLPVLETRTLLVNVK